MIIELALVMTLGQGLDASTIARDLEQFEQRLAASWQAGDCAAWGAMLAPEWSVIHITGNVITKAQALEMCKAPRTPNEQQVVDEISVRSFGDTAVVTGRTTVITGGATATTLKLRFTDVFIRREGRWQVVASHATRLGA
jgi:ketosteroid isomerase-like protein